MQFVRESIFLSALRTFCSAFAGILGIAIAVVLVVIGISSMSGPEILPPEKIEVSLAPDAHGDQTLLPASAPVIVRIDFTGVLGLGDYTAENLEKILNSSHQDFFHEGRLKGLFLYINTPGGIASEVDNMYRMLRKYKQKYNIPIYAFVDGLCASGGMYIAAAADKVYATPESTIGSIGVIFGPTFNFSGLMAKYGVESLTLTEGKDKDMLNSFRPWQEGEDASLRTIMAKLYDRFVNIMVESRPQIDKSKLVNDYGAQLYLSQDAQQIGYIDVADSDYEMAMTDLVHAANISEHTRYQVLQMAAPSSFFSTLFNNKCELLKGKVTHVFQAGPHFNSELSGKILYFYAPAG